MDPIRYHIEHKYDGTWLGMREGSHCPSLRAATLQEAERRTLEIAQRWEATVIVHLRNGTTREHAPGNPIATPALQQHVRIGTE